MDRLELILSFLASGSLVGNIIQFVTLRAVRKQKMAEASKTMDEVLYRRIDFLDERVTNLEKLACFDKECKLRK